jgi:hypothetical protein
MTMRTNIPNNREINGWLLLLIIPGYIPHLIVIQNVTIDPDCSADKALAGMLRSFVAIMLELNRALSHKPRVFCLQEFTGSPFQWLLTNSTTCLSFHCKGTLDPCHPLYVGAVSCLCFVICYYRDGISLSELNK